MRTFPFITSSGRVPAFLAGALTGRIFDIGCHEGEEEVLDTRTAGRELHRLGLGQSRAESCKTACIAGLTTLAHPSCLSLPTVLSLSFTPKER